MKSCELFSTYISEVFPCAIEYGDYTGLTDEEELSLNSWLSDLYEEAAKIHPKANIYFDYLEDTELDYCDISGDYGTCVRVVITALYPEV